MMIIINYQENQLGVWRGRLGLFWGRLGPSWGWWWRLERDEKEGEAGGKRCETEAEQVVGKSPMGERDTGGWGRLCSP